MRVEKSPEMVGEMGHAVRMGEIMEQCLRRTGLEVELKEDGSFYIPDCDGVISERTGAYFTERGMATVSEEENGRTAPYGTRTAAYVDPTDNTADLVRNNRRLGEPDLQSSAAYSCGIVIDGHVERAIADFPLLLAPRIYWAEDGHAIKSERHRPDDKILEADDSPVRRGVVLVSDNKIYPHMSAIQKMGFRVLPIGGSVFKACCVVDPELPREYDPKLLQPDEEVVGFVSRNTYAHDFMAAWLIAQNAGAWVSGLDLTEQPPLEAGKHPCAFARDRETGMRLLEALAVELQ